MSEPLDDPREPLEVDPQLQAEAGPGAPPDVDPEPSPEPALHCELYLAMTKDGRFVCDGPLDTNMSGVLGLLALAEKLLHHKIELNFIDEKMQASQHAMQRAAQAMQAQGPKIAVANGPLPQHPGLGRFPGPGKARRH